MQAYKYRILASAKGIAKIVGIWAGGGRKGTHINGIDTGLAGVLTDVVQPGIVRGQV